jgi:hypothetical protein
MAEEQIAFDIYQPFGPSVLKTKATSNLCRCLKQAI